MSWTQARYDVMHEKQRLLLFCFQPIGVVASAESLTSGYTGSGAGSAVLHFLYRQVLLL